MRQKLARHILIFVLVFVVLAVAIWLGPGPVVHSWQI